MAIGLEGRVKIERPTNISNISRINEWVTDVSSRFGFDSHVKIKCLRNSDDVIMIMRMPVLLCRYYIVVVVVVVVVVVYPFVDIHTKSTWSRVERGG